MPKPQNMWLNISINFTRGYKPVVLTLFVDDLE